MSLDGDLPSHTLFDMATRFVPRSPLGELVAAGRTEILAAAARRHASNVRIFASVARGEDNGTSDVDRLVDLDPEAKPLDLLEFACDLEDVLGVKVDVGTPALLCAFLRDEVLAEAVVL
jgi:predicted nucleotidyltransferase